MNLCQPYTNQFSCGSCCGIFNIDLEFTSYEKILKERTSDFRSNVKFDEPWRMIDYRQRREDIEKDLQKIDSLTYSCPYLGFIDECYQKIGCMIHPENTKDPKSQNFSFYGSSICQGYSCQNYDRTHSDLWQRLFESIASNFFEYSMLAADHITVNYIENFFLESGIQTNLIFTKYNEVLKELLMRKFKKKELHTLLHQTSFEIDMDETRDNFFEKIQKRLKITKKEEIYKELLNIYKSGNSSSPDL